MFHSFILTSLTHFWLFLRKCVRSMDQQTDGPMDGWTHPLIEMWGTSKQALPGNLMCHQLLYKKIGDVFWKGVTDGWMDIGTSHYGSKASKMTYWGKRSITHSPHLLCSTLFCCAPFCSAVLHYTPLYSMPLCLGACSWGRKWWCTNDITCFNLTQIQPILHQHSCPITPNWCCCVSGILHCPCLQITAPAQPPRLMPVRVSGLIFISLCLIPLDRRKDLKDNGEKKRDRAKH